MVYVVDASVAARFLLVEDYSDEAGRVLEGFREGKFDLKAPRLVVYEVGNVLWKAVKQGLIGVDEAKEKFSVFLGLKIDSIELDDKGREEVLEWAAENEVTYYDSAYVMSSIKTGGTLLTADDALYSSAQKEVSATHLRDYQK
jgi:predicted nucleic acid-binding protein